MSLSLDKVATMDEIHQLRIHLERCQSCRAKWASMRRISQLFAGAPPVPPPTGFAARVGQRLAQREARRRWVLGGIILFMGTIVSLTVLALSTIIGAFMSLEQLAGYFLLLSHGPQLVKLVSIGRSLVKAGWLALTAFLSPSGQPILASYSLAVFALTALWVRLVISQQRGYLRKSLARG